MYENLSYFAAGENFFRKDESIYINKSYEEVESHLHAHDFLEIAYVAAGCGIHRIGCKEYSVSKGDLFIINYNTPHEFRSLPGLPESRLVIYNCVFTPDFLDYSLVNCKDFSDITYHFLFRSMFPEEDGNRSDIKLLGRDSRDIEEIYEKMHREYQIREQGYIEILRAYTIELLIIIFRLCHKNDPLHEKYETHRRKIIEKVIRYMKDNFASEIKVEDLSTMAFLSPNYFSRLFKDCTSMTVSEYIQKFRMEEACRLLMETDKKVIDISSEVGYRDLKFFNRVFKRLIGKTPGEYRKFN